MDLAKERPPDSSPTRTKARIWIAAGLAAAIFAAGLATLVSRASGDPNLRRSRAEIRHLFTLFELPPGAVRTGNPGEEDLNQPATGIIGSDHLLDVVQYWRFPMTPVDASLWVQTHPPKGLTKSGSSSGSTQGFSYRDSDTDAYTYPNLEISIASDGIRSTPVRIDAVLIWLSSDLVRDTTSGPRIRFAVAEGCPPRLGPSVSVRNPRDALKDRLLPEGRPTVGLVCRYVNGPERPPTTAIPLSSDEAISLAVAIGRVHLTYPGRFSYFSCGTVASVYATIDLLALRYPGRQDVSLWYTEDGCGSLRNGYLDAKGYNTATLNWFKDALFHVVHGR